MQEVGVTPINKSIKVIFRALIPQNLSITFSQ